MTDLKEDSAPWAGAESLTANVSGADSSTDAEALSIVRWLAEIGVPIFHARAKYGVPGEHQLPARWQESRPGADSLAAVEAWRPGDGLAMVCGAQGRFDVLDVDPRNGGAVGESELRAAGAWPRVFGMTATPSGGTHYLIRALSVRKGVPAPGVDLQAGLATGEGRGFVWLPPTVRRSKVDKALVGYRWTLRPTDPRAAVADQDERAARAALRGRMAGAREVVSLTSAPAAAPAPVEPFACASTRDGSWTRDQARVEIAKRLDEVRTATDGTINTTLNNSSLRIGRFVGSGTVKRDWAEAALRDALLTSGHGWAELNGDDRGTIRSGLDAGIKQPFVITEDGARKVNGSEIARPRKSIRDRAIDSRDLGSIPPPTPLISGILDAGVIGLLSGKFGTYKSFASISMAASVATGVPFLGFEVVTPGPVLYVAAEGASGLRARLDAWRTEHYSGQELPAGRLTVINGRVNLLDPDDVNELTEYIKDLGAVFTIIDTLHKCTPGLEENSNSDMSKPLDAAAQIIEETGSHVLFDHHTGHRGERARGASSIEDDIDNSWVIRLSDNESDDRGPENQRTMVHRKTKDGELSGEIALALKKVPGTGSCVLDRADSLGTPGMTWLVQQSLADKMDEYGVPRGMTILETRKAGEELGLGKHAKTVWAAVARLRRPARAGSGAPDDSESDGE